MKKIKQIFIFAMLVQCVLLIPTAVATPGDQNDPRWKDFISWSGAAITKAIKNEHWYGETEKDKETWLHNAAGLPYFFWDALCKNLPSSECDRFLRAFTKMKAYAREKKN